MNIYIIKQGLKDPRSMLEFSTLKNARQIKNELLRKNGCLSLHIVTTKLDPGIKEMNAGLFPYEITMDYFGNIRNFRIAKEHPTSDDDFEIIKHTKNILDKKKYPNVSDALMGVIWARNKKHAIKLTHARRRTQIAQGNMTYCGIDTKGVL